MRIVVGMFLSLLALGCAHSTPVATPARAEPRTEAECRACDGQWGIHGLATEASCVCKTLDRGKRCRDGTECEGECIATGDDKEIVDAGPPARGYFIGRCSDHHRVFGCFKFLMDGTASHGPINLDEPVQELCVD